MNYRITLRSFDYDEGYNMEESYLIVDAKNEEDAIEEAVDDFVDINPYVSRDLVQAVEVEEF